jgi:hypothetical protein
MTEREIIEEFAVLLRGFAQTQKEFLDRVVDEHYRAQEVLVDRLFARLNELLAARHGPPPPPPSPLRMN